MKGLSYSGSNDSVQMSFKYKRHINLSIASSAATSAAIPETEVFLSLMVAAHVKIGSGAATTSDMALPAGVWPILINSGDTISVIKLTGGSDGQASIIIGG